MILYKLNSRLDIMNNKPIENTSNTSDKRQIFRGNSSEIKIKEIKQNEIE